MQFGKGFLPVSKEDMVKRGWDELDFLYIVGEAYVDHPSFGHAIISRVLADAGFKVGIISLPDWNDVESFKLLGTPKLGVLVSSGNIDSMVNHYTVAKKRRHNDSYAPGGKGFMRPDRAVIVYCNKVRQAFGKIPIIIGGVEASLRRFAHYDYWDDKVRRSVLFDSGADLLIYGMGEKQIIEIANHLKNGKKIRDIKNVRGTAYLTDDISDIENSSVFTPSYEEMCQSKKNYARGFLIEYREQDHISGKRIIQKHGVKYLVQNAPASPLSTRELDHVYSLPYERTYHPMYEQMGGVPAIEEVQFSIAQNRGCFGGCNFCALTFHQGRMVTARSDASVIAEAYKIVNMPGFKGYIHDVGGPTANFRRAACEKQAKHGVCKDRQCLFPTPCKNLVSDHTEYLKLLRKLREIPGVKKVFVRSGIRFDYLMADPNDEFFRELVLHHISGQLKVAPEHVSDNVLSMMGKPKNIVFRKFCDKYYALNKEYGKNQFMVPYLMSSHPGSTLKDAIELALYLKEINYTPEQVQDFYPTPGTMSTTMFYTGLDPRTMKKVYVPRDAHEKAMQRALLQYKNPKNYELVAEALKKANRSDLIGFDKKCLIRPRINQRKNSSKKGRIASKSTKSNTKNNKITSKGTK